MLDDATERRRKWDEIVQKKARIQRDHSTVRERFRAEVERQRKVAGKDAPGKDVLRV